MFWYMLLAGSDSRIIAWILPRQGHTDGIIASDSRKHHLRVKTWGLSNNLVLSWAKYARSFPLFNSLGAGGSPHEATRITRMYLVQPRNFGNPSKTRFFRTRF